MRTLKFSLNLELWAFSQIVDSVDTVDKKI